jgi:hypothetical protein
MIAAAVSLAAAALAAGTPLATSTTVDPGRANFADTIEATATVLVDPDEIDPGDVKVVAAFDPLDVLAGPVTRRRARGARTEISIRWQVVCLDEECVPGDAPRSLRMPPLHVTAVRADGTRVESVVRWPVVTIIGRVSRAEAGAAVPPFRRETGLPPPGYRVSPRRLAAVLDAVAAVLLLGAAALGLRAGARLRRRRAAERFARLTPLERALLYARDAERRDSADRRRALGLLGRVLEGTGDALGGAASQLAWSSRDPSPEQIASMVGEVERGERV